MVDGWNDLYESDGTPRVGAMYWRRHTPEPYDPAPRPMPHLAVLTPAGVACLDCPDTDPPHGHWERTGEPPNVTVTPSLNINNEEWHGWLTEGKLTP